MSSDFWGAKVPRLIKATFFLYRVFFITTLLFVLFSFSANYSALAFNGWKMPVDSKLASWNFEGPLHKKMDKTSRLKWFCDIFPVRNEQGEITEVQSIGDIAGNSAKLTSIPMLAFLVLFLTLSCFSRWCIKRREKLHGSQPKDENNAKERRQN